MKLTSIELHPSNSSEVFVLSFRDPTRQQPYNVKTVSGLDAGDIVPKYYGVSGTSDIGFYNLSMVKRDIVLQIELNPQFSQNKTYSDLRDDLYKMIASSRTGLIQLQFKNGLFVVAAISGFATKVEALHFDKTPTVQITITPTDPMLRALTPVTVDVSALDPALSNLQDLLSTAPHGFTFDMTVVTASASLAITDPGDASWSFRVTPIGGFLIGDVFHYSSETNDKELYLVRGGVKIYLADVIFPGSIWPVMFPGDNPYAFENPTHFHWTALSYYNSYWGV